MFRRHALVAAGCSLGISMMVAVHAQSPSAKAATISDSDYIEIQQLVARYPYAFDTHANNGYDCARLFAPDGTFAFGNRTVQGLENIAAFVRGDPPGQFPVATHIFGTNVIITPSPEGATGKAYVVSLDIGEGGKASAIHAGGHYEDVYVKTTDGWRFKKRTYILSQKGPPPEVKK
jgi:hypothetical protein